MNDQVVGRIYPSVDVIDHRSRAGTPGGGQEDANRDDILQTWTHFLRPLCFETRSAGQRPGNRAAPFAIIPSAKSRCQQIGFHQPGMDSDTVLAKSEEIDAMNDLPEIC
jgi:hypothetical protein